MKIALIGTTLFHQGAEYVLASLARGLFARGHQVDVVLSHVYADDVAKHPDWKPFELSKGIDLKVMSGRRARENIFELRNLVKNGGYDVIMNHADPYEVPLALAGLLIAKRPKLINVEHGPCARVDKMGNIVHYPQTINQRLKNVFLRKLDAQFVVSSGVVGSKSKTTGIPMARFFTVYNPVIDEVYRNKIKSPPTHSWLANPERPVVVAAGIFRKLKGFHWLIKSFVEVHEQTGARLVIFGDGLERPYFEQVVRDNGLSDCVSLPGFTDNLPAELKGASCFVCSSEVESFSVVLVEAMACGVPVVSTQCPYGPPEILANGKYGELVGLFDEDGMAKAIIKALSKDRIVPPPESVAPYTIEATLDRYEAAIKSVMEGGR